MIAGNTEAVDRASELLRSGSAKRVIKLNVSAPFHSALMMPAQERLASDLDEIEFGDLTVPLVTNVDAAIIRRGPLRETHLLDRYHRRYAGLESMELLIREGVDTFVEVGPGKVLTGLMRQISREVKCFNVEDAASLKSAAANLGVS